MTLSPNGLLCDCAFSIAQQLEPRGGVKVCRLTASSALLSRVFLYLQEEIVVIEQTKDDGRKAQIVYRTGGIVSAAALEALCVRVGLRWLTANCCFVMDSDAKVTSTNEHCVAEQNHNIIRGHTWQDTVGHIVQSESLSQLVHVQGC